MIQIHKGGKHQGSGLKGDYIGQANGSIVNADLNGSANILAKVASNLGIDLDLLGRRCNDQS